MLARYRLRARRSAGVALGVLLVCLGFFGLLWLKTGISILTIVVGVAVIGWSARDAVNGASWGSHLPPGGTLASFGLAALFLTGAGWIALIASESFGEGLTERAWYSVGAVAICLVFSAGMTASAIAASRRARGRAGPYSDWVSAHWRNSLVDSSGGPSSDDDRRERKP